MSSNKRFRWNLNASTPVPRRQVAQPQVPVAATHQTPRPSPAVQDVQQNQLQTPISRRPVKGCPSTTNPPLASSSTIQTGHAPAQEVVIDHLVTAVEPLLITHQQSISARMEKMEGAISTFSDQIKGTLNDVQGETKKIVDALRQSLIVQQEKNRAVNSRLEGLEMLIGTSHDKDKGKSILNKLEAISFAVEELLERVNDPYALGSSQLGYRERGTSPAHRAFVDGPIPVHVEFGTSPIQNSRVDSAVQIWTSTSSASATRTLESESPPRRDIGTSPTRQICRDASMNPQLHLRETYHDMGTNPIKLTYVDVATYAQIQESPEQRSFVSTGVATSPVADKSSLSTSSIHHYSSDALALVRDVSSPTIPKEHIDHRDSDTPLVSRRMAPVNWLNEAATINEFQVASGDNLEDKLIPIFLPDASQAKQQYSLLNEQNISLEGSIASLRHDTFGDSLAGPILSSPPRPITTFYTHPPISSLPSPASSLSPPPLTISTAQPPSQNLPESRSASQTPVEVAPLKLESIQTTASRRSPLGSEHDSELAVTRLVADSLPTSRLTSLTPSPQQIPIPLLPELVPDVSISSSLKAANPISPIELSPSISTSPISKKDENLNLNDVRVESAITKIPPLKHTPSRQPVRRPTAVPSPIYVSSRSASPLSSLDTDLDADSDVRIIPAKKNIKEGRKSKTGTSPLPSQRKRILNLKSTVPGRQSAAATRVKKRKAKPGEETEPPLKRARQKMDQEGTNTKVASKGSYSKAENNNSTPRGKDKRQSSTPTSVSKDKDRRLLRSRSIIGCKWPPKAKANSKFNKTFIECDVCAAWYHYGCVGLVPGDIRVRPDEIFTCPPCMNGGANPLVPAKNPTCARPDCSHKEQPQNEFFVSGIVGRATKTRSGRGRNYIWLVKWAGYPIQESTWEDEESMGDPVKLIEEFNKRASQEGFSKDDVHITILLQEAIDGGFTNPNA